MIINFAIEDDHSRFIFIIDWLATGFKIDDFQALVTKLKKRGARSPKALAAWIGRKKYGKKKFQAAAAKGKKMKGMKPKKKNGAMAGMLKNRFAKKSMMDSDSDYV